MKHNTHSSNTIKLTDSKINSIKRILTDKEFYALLKDAYKSTKELKETASREFKNNQFSTSNKSFNDFLSDFTIMIYKLYYLYMIYSKYFKKEITWDELCDKSQLLAEDVDKDYMEVQISLMRLDDITIQSSDNNDLDIYLTKISEYLKGINDVRKEIKNTSTSTLNPKAEGFSAMSQELRAFDAYEFLNMYRSLLIAYVKTLNKIKKEGGDNN